MNPTVKVVWREMGLKIMVLTYPTVEKAWEGEDRQRFQHQPTKEHLLDLLCPEVPNFSVSTICPKEEGERCSGQALLGWHLPCPYLHQRQGAALLLPLQNTAMKRKHPWQETLGETIRKKCEGTDKTILVLYLPTSGCPARRSTVISSSSPAPSHSSCDMGEKSPALLKP